MSSISNLLPLLAMVTEEPDADRALDNLATAALELTRSRNAMIARMNDELGLLELRHGTGEEWSRREDAEGFKLEIEAGAGIVAFVAATGQSFKSGNVRDEPRYRNLFNTTKSEIAVPVLDCYKRVRAVINVESDKEEAYGDDSVEVIQALAHMAAIILDQEDARVREEALIQIGNALDQAMTEQELIDQVIRVASDVLRFQAFSIFLYEPRSDSFVLKGSVGRLKEKVGQLRYSRGEGCTGWVCETGQPILLENPQSDPRWRGQFVEFPSEQIASFLAVPVVWRSKCIGALRAIRRVTENKYLDNRFTESDQRVLFAIAEQVATALQSIRSIDKLVHSERMAAWGELSAKSSHMIGNRVFALKGDVNELKYLVEDQKTTNEQLAELQKSLHTNVTRVEEILQDFRDFLTATQTVVEAEDINDVVSSTVKEVFPRRSKVELDLRLGKELPKVSIDSKKLRRAISELVENSMNYMEEGKMSVRTGLPEKEMLRRAKVAPGKQYVKIEIEDSGPGVNPDQKNLIFQPFFSGRVKGMGLGLSIVKGIVDAHGGEVFESGKPGRGAKFVILLPVADRS